jgi:hypothetical protein
VIHLPEAHAKCNPRVPAGLAPTDFGVAASKG